ncbi:MAG: hypothetical protein LC808_43805, partial [Actinobacteria bacterium]|nr:hypothetical protein [Actinomycetota bacterium]
MVVIGVDRILKPRLSLIHGRHHCGPPWSRIPAAWPRPQQIYSTKAIRGKRIEMCNYLKPYIYHK